MVRDKIIYKLSGWNLNYNYFMLQAYNQAIKAQQINEVPIGCVIVYNNNIIATGYNERNTKKNVLKHGEITAINEACNYIGDWRLEGCTMFVTLEPCPMCAGAVLQSRMKSLVFGASNPKAGSVSSILNILNNDSYNHKVQVVKGVMEVECSNILSDFFTKLRSK